MSSSERVRVAVDAAGGDRPSSVVLEGVAAALEADDGVDVILTGPAEVVQPFADAHGGRCEAVACTQVIGMDEHPSEAIRSKRDSSIVVGCKLVRQGRAQGFFSAGSTGAVMAAATVGIGRIRGIDRPALTAVLPGVTPTVLLDLGANADCKPEYLVQFAAMGRAYSRIVLGVDEPVVGLLNIGSEDTKGSSSALAEFAALREGAAGFRGNAEPSDLYGGTFDVIVADGFTGNVALKTLEATAKYILGEVKAAVKSNPLRTVAGAVLKPSLVDIKKQLSGDDFGGAVLLGINGVVVIGHGATSPEAVKNGVGCVARAVRGGLVHQVEEYCKP